jgi:hypothetical protein
MLGYIHYCKTTIMRHLKMFGPLAKGFRMASALHIGTPDSAKKRCISVTWTAYVAKEASHELGTKGRKRSRCLAMSALYLPVKIQRPEDPNEAGQNGNTNR